MPLHRSTRQTPWLPIAPPHQKTHFPHTARQQAESPSTPHPQADTVKASTPAKSPSTRHAGHTPPANVASRQPAAKPMTPIDAWLSRASPAVPGQTRRGTPLRRDSPPGQAGMEYENEPMDMDSPEPSRLHVEYRGGGLLERVAPAVAEERVERRSTRAAEKVRDGW